MLVPSLPKPTPAINLPSDICVHDVLVNLVFGLILSAENITDPTGYKASATALIKLVPKLPSTSKPSPARPIFRELLLPKPSYTHSRPVGGIGAPLACKTPTYVSLILVFVREVVAIYNYIYLYGMQYTIKSE